MHNFSTKIPPKKSPSNFQKIIDELQVASDKVTSSSTSSHLHNNNFGAGASGGSGNHANL